MDTPDHCVGLAHCPSCERYIGPAAVCPYCDCDQRPQPLLRAMRWAALLLATIGLACLFLAARRREAPIIRIGEINPMMNFANVRVAGAVVRKPYVSEKDGLVDYASFLIDDGSGELRVGANGAVARLLVAEARLPNKGSRVDVCGVLDVTGDGKVRLRLRSAVQLSIGQHSP